MKKILLLSAGSPCRAIMAESILKKHVDKDLELEFVGAGLEANNIINENAMKVLIKEGVDVTKLSPRILEDVVDTDFDLVLTICSHSKEICPQFPRVVPTIHMEFPVIDDEDEATCKALAHKIKTQIKPIILKNIL